MGVSSTSRRSARTRRARIRRRPTSRRSASARAQTTTIYKVKIRKAEEFLGDGDKVKVSVRLRGRENAHPELGRQLLDKIVEALKHAAVVERPPIMEARIISMILSKAPGWEPQKAAPPQGPCA